MCCAGNKFYPKWVGTTIISNIPSSRSQITNSPTKPRDESRRLGRHTNLYSAIPTAHTTHPAITRLFCCKTVSSQSSLSVLWWQLSAFAGDVAQKEIPRIDIAGTTSTRLLAICPTQVHIHIFIDNFLFSSNMRFNKCQGIESCSYSMDKCVDLTWHLSACIGNTYSHIPTQINNRSRCERRSLILTLTEHMMGACHMTFSGLVLVNRYNVSDSVLSIVTITRVCVQSDLWKVKLKMSWNDDTFRHNNRIEEFQQTHNVIYGNPRSAFNASDSDKMSEMVMNCFIAIIACIIIAVLVLVVRVCLRFVTNEDSTNRHCRGNATLTARNMPNTSNGMHLLLIFSFEIFYFSTNFVYLPRADTMSEFVEMRFIQCVRSPRTVWLIDMKLKIEYSWFSSLIWSDQSIVRSGKFGPWSWHISSS